MNGIYLKLFIFILTSSLLTSCYKENISDVSVSTEVDPIYAFPLGKLSFVLSDMIFDLDSAIKQYDDSLIYVELSQPLFTLESSEMVSISGINMPAQSLTIPTGIITSNVVLNIDSLAFDFGPHGDDSSYIDSILIKSANLSISINSTDISPARLSFTFGGIIRGGSALTVDADLTSSSDYSNTINLGVGDKIDYTTGQGNNNFPLGLRLELQPRTGGSLTGTLTVAISLSVLEYSSAHGYFGRYTVTTPEQNIAMTVFELMPENAQFFQEPAIRLIFNNDFGIPISFFFNKMQFVSTVNSNSIDLSGSGVPTSASNATVIQYPSTITGSSVKTTVAFTNDNSNIAEALNMSPNELNLTTSTYLNQNGYTNSNFIKDDSELDLALNVELPLAAKIQQFIIGDTIPFSFSNFSDDVNMIKKIIIQTTVRNMFPTDGDLVIGLLDENYNLLKALDQTTLIESAKVEDGDVVEVTKAVPVIEIDREIIQQFTNTSFLSFKITIKTSREGNVWVKFYSYYDIKMTVGIKAELDADLNKL